MIRLLGCCCCCCCPGCPCGGPGAARKAKVPPVFNTCNFFTIGQRIKTTPNAIENFFEGQKHQHNATKQRRMLVCWRVGICNNIYPFIAKNQTQLFGDYFFRDAHDDDNATAVTDCGGSQQRQTDTKKAKT